MQDSADSEGCFTVDPRDRVSNESSADAVIHEVTFEFFAGRLKDLPRDSESGLPPPRTRYLEAPPTALPRRPLGFPDRPTRHEHTHALASTPNLPSYPHEARCCIASFLIIASLCWSAQAAESRLPNATHTLKART